MTAPCFLALTGEPDLIRKGLSSLVPTPGGAFRLNRIVDCPDLILFASPETPHLLLDEQRGLILGQLFGKGEGCAPRQRLSPSEAKHAAWSGGKTLIADSWGHYVAFLRDEGAVTVLRDPSGALPVQYCEMGGVSAYFSHAALGEEFGLHHRPVDEGFLRQWLTFPFLRTARTGIEGVNELVPGTARTTRDGEARLSILWTPWSAAAPARQLRDFDEAARRLRTCLLATVAPQMRDLGPLVLQLSGGLDSSIVAACLAAAGLPFNAANFVTRMPDGDERDYARLVTEAFGAPLAELPEDALPLELGPSRHFRLRPPLSPVLQPLHRAFHAFARASRAGTLVTGAGGDNLFCYLTTASPALDAARDVGFGQALSTLRDIAARAECTIWTAAHYAVRKRLGLARRSPWQRDERFLAADALARRPDPHPWLDAPPDARPGKVEHVMSLVRAYHFLDAEYPSGLAVHHPLLNQPLMELCLAIPSWLWVRGGRDRALARAAFADLLPEEVVLRRTKGRLESMCARAFANNRTQLAALLLDGELAGRRLIDRAALEAYLRGTGPARDDAYFRVFDLASLESWLRTSAG